MFQSVSSFGGAQPQQTSDPFQAEAQRIITESHARLNQLKTTRQSDFVTFSYVLCDNPQQVSNVLSQPFNASVHLDAQKWQAAKTANFAETYPLPISGFAALEARVQRQVAEVGNFCSLAERAEKEIGNLQLHISDVSLATAKKLKQRHREVRRDLGLVIADLEERALRLGRAAQDPHRQREIADKLALLRTRLETLAVATSSVQSEIANLQKPKPREISDFAQLEKQKISALDRAIENFKQKNVAKLREQISRCTSSSSSDALIARFLQTSDRMNLPGRAALVARGGAGTVLSETEAEFVAIAGEKKKFSVANVAQLASLLERTVGNPRNFADAKELLEAVRSIGARKADEISDQRPTVEYLAKKAARTLFGFHDVPLAAIVNQFPTSDGWKLLYHCVRLGAWEAADEISKSRPETRELVAYLRQRFCLSELPEGTAKTWASELPSFADTDSVFRRILLSLAQPDEASFVVIARHLPDATMEDWLWYTCAHATSGLTEADRAAELAKVRAKLETSFWGRGELPPLQRARLLLLVDAASPAVLEAAKAETAFAALLTLTLAKLGFAFESEIASTILFPYLEKFAISDQVKFVGILPSKLRLEAYKRLVLSGAAPLDLLGHWDMTTGTFRAGVLQQALADSEFVRMCGALVSTAVERGDYRKALRLAMLAGDREVFSDLVSRATALVNSASPVIRGALDVHGLRGDLDLFARAL